MHENVFHQLQAWLVILNTPQLPCISQIIHFILQSFFFYPTGKWEIAQISLLIASLCFWVYDLSLSIYTDRQDGSTVFLTDQMIAVSVWKIPRLSDYPLTEDYTHSASHLRLLKPPQDAVMQPITAIRTSSLVELMKAILSVLAHFKAGLIGLFRQTPKLQDNCSRLD